MFGGSRLSDGFSTITYNAVRRIPMAIIQCEKCGAKNRVEHRENMQPVCGRCGAPLRVSSQTRVVEVTDESFAQLLGSAGNKPILIDCWAEWCGPCRMLTPTIEQLGAESADRWVIAKLNVDENPRVASQFQISSIPTMLLFKDGNLVD